MNRLDPIGLDDTARGMLLDELGETPTQKNAKKWKEDFLNTAKTGLELLPQNDFSEAVLGESLGGQKLSGTEQAGAAAGLFAGLFGKAKKCATAAKDWWKARKAKKAAEAAAKLEKGQLVGKGVRDFMKCEKSLSELSKEEIESSIRGYQNAADTAKNEIHKAYQEARIKALRGEGPPPGPLNEFTENFGK